MENPFNQPPVFEYDQVITKADLINMMDNLSFQATCEGLNEEEQIRYNAVMRALEVLVTWINLGKPADIGFDNKEEL